MTRAVVVHPDAAAVAQATAARLLVHLLDAQSAHRPLHIALTGGTVGTAVLAAIGESPVRHAVDWTGVHLWWGDERFLPAGDPERNETGARSALLDELPVPAENVHPVPPADGTRTAERAAEAYAAELASFAPEGAEVPPFDVVLLGMGPDGHVASLFPGHPALDAGGVAVAVHDSPKPPPDRVSLTLGALEAAVQVWLVVAGAEKAEALSRALAGDPATPASRVHGASATLWLVDLAAAAG